MTIKPQQLAQTQINSVIALYSNGQIQEALDSVEALIKDYPNEALLYNICGACYAGLGQLDAAVKSYEQALAIKLDYAEVHNNLGIVLKELDQLEDAVKSYEKALAIKPDYIEAHNNLGIVLKELRQLDAAVKSFKKALAIKPDYIEVNYNLGVTLKELGRLEDAVKSYEKAVALKPDYADAHYNLGNTLKELGQSAAAVKSYEKALAVNPDDAEAHNNLGNAFKVLGRLDDAVKSYEKAVAVNPDYAEAHNNFGATLKELDQLDAAVNCYEKALALKPDYADAHANRGNALKRLKQLDEALASYESAIALDPDLDFILGTLLRTKMSLCIWDDLAHHLNELTNKINNGEKVAMPFALLALIDDPEIQRKTAEIYANERYPQSHVLSKIERYPKHKKIRIGYFSADFKNHPAAFLTAELYEIHDRNRFEIHAFSYGPDTQDKMNLRIKAGVDHFHDVRMMSYEDTAMLARSVELDIAVDMGGYTKDCRPNIFAEGSAPIQVSYLGYPGTMAVDYMDYLIADRTLIPEEKQHHYSEKIVYMPNSYQVNVSKRSVSEDSLLRHELGLPNTAFVFCCFNNNYKITPTTFAGWMRILKAVEDSVLWLLEDNHNTAKNLKKEAMKFGINEDRLVFAKRIPVEEYLNSIKQADLFIDTLPYNAHTTASDALRMGLPVLTCIGHSFASRVAASVINAVNLPELITTTQEQYESLAIELATNPEKLKIIKDKLVNNLPTAPLYDTPLFTRHLESAYLTMYDRYQNGLDTDHIYVED
jgi:predicted O-linked N-acetylglucosamine transferase (SPINDLY family)